MSAARLTMTYLRWVKYVDFSDDCWLWKGAVLKVGYGRFYDGECLRVVHRWAYEFFVGPIPKGLVLDHLCRVRHCVNPLHLEPVTPRENVMRSPIAPAAVNAAKTHCIRGHGFTPENTYTQSGGQRGCVECRRIQGRQNKERNAKYMREWRKRNPGRYRERNAEYAREWRKRKRLEKAVSV